ncbi:hypothetical protein PR048_020411 [Dryococelus australis]|uniref:Uncharacterized protein n=1 Tax=Dryococelus australis TaxID=614101 RepID=A0ABQ9H6L7_9NEOP|nr:hypothetical protein PR048_020411 [Dryococelus australis]
MKDKNKWALCHRHHTMLKTRKARMLLIRESLMMTSQYVWTNQLKVINKRLLVVHHNLQQTSSDANDFWLCITTYSRPAPTQTTSGCASQPTADQLRRKRMSLKRKTVSDELDSCVKEYSFAVRYTRKVQNPLAQMNSFYKACTVI